MSVEKNYCAYRRCRKPFTPKCKNEVQKFCSDNCSDLAHKKKRWESDGLGKRRLIITLDNGLEVIDNIVWKAVGYNKDNCRRTERTKPIINVTTFRFKNTKYAAA